MHFAPVQGHTDAPYRHFHAAIYGRSPLTYYTPFIRLEHGALRRRDLADFTSDLCKGINTVPQIIFRDEEELSALVHLVADAGAREINLNMGCPFPLQTARGRGAATVANPQLASAVARIVDSNPHISFSVKMRLGMNEPYEWRQLLECLNEVKLTHVTVHPRVARQQYGGELCLDSFSALLSESKNPVVFNGDILSIADAQEVMRKFPSIAGIMIGRGALGRPSFFEEIETGTEWDIRHRLDTMLEFHRSLFEYYKATLCGDAQILAKIKPFWEYAENEIGRKAWKAIRKATNMARYNSAIALIG